MRIKLHSILVFSFLILTIISCSKKLSIHTSEKLCFDYDLKHSTCLQPTVKGSFYLTIDSNINSEIIKFHFQHKYETPDFSMVISSYLGEKAYLFTVYNMQGCNYQDTLLLEANKFYDIHKCGGLLITTIFDFITSDSIYVTKAYYYAGASKVYLNNRKKWSEFKPDKINHFYMIKGIKDYYYSCDIKYASENHCYIEDIKPRNVPNSFFGHYIYLKLW